MPAQIASPDGCGTKIALEKWAHLSPPRLNSPASHRGALLQLIRRTYCEFIFLHHSFLTRQLEKSLTYKTETTWDRGKSRRVDEKTRKHLSFFFAGIELRVVVGFPRPRDREGKSYIANFNVVSARTNGYVWKLPAAACPVKRIAFLRVTAHLELARVALAGACVLLSSFMGIARTKTNCYRGK